VVQLVGNDGPVDTLMEGHRTFAFSPINMGVRVMVAHYIAFCRDKLSRPELFCWPGIVLAGNRATPEFSRFSSSTPLAVPRSGIGR
jgi:hypothetical protein